MAWIRTVAPSEARGLLRRLYEAAVRRAGKVYNIIRIQSLRPRALRSSTQLYLEVMHACDSGPSRVQREMIAVTVSQINGCFY
jgi:alkylhydroperoxidase family enzyme